MRFKGLDFKKSRNHLARMSKEGDKYIDGTQVPQHYQVVVLVSQCDFKGTCLNRDLYSADNAPHIKDMTGHSLTNMFYGKWKKKTSEYGTLVKDIDTGCWKDANEYYQCTVYMVKNGSVYKASIKRAITPRQLAIVNKD